jgi:hypothetical protein
VHQAEGATRCAYFVRWSDDEPHPPHLTMGYGAWDEGTSWANSTSIYAELRPHKLEGDASWSITVVRERRTTSQIFSACRAAHVTSAKTRAAAR